MSEIRAFYTRVWEEYADPRYHPITAVALQIQSSIVLEWIREYRPRRILDLGCGPSPVIRPEWAPLVVSADIVQEMLRELKQRTSCKVVCLDAHMLPFGQRQFDFVWCGLLVDHIRDVATWIQALATLLRPGGMLGLASWQQSSLPVERYPDGKMCFTLATGEELLVSSYLNWDEALRVLATLDHEMKLKSYPIVPDQYVLQLALASCRPTGQ